MPIVPFPTIAFSSTWVADRDEVGAGIRFPRADRPPYTFLRHEQILMAAVQRALGHGDLEYLERQPFDTRVLQRYARSARKRFLERYLEQKREAFRASARVAREFAADSDAPELAFAVLRQTVRFHCLWAALRFSLVFNMVGPAWRLTETLVKTVRPAASSPAVEAMHGKLS